MTSMRAAWARDLANCEYLQALHPCMEILLYDARQVLSPAQEAKAKIADAKQLAQQNTGNAASDAAPERRRWQTSRQPWRTWKMRTTTELQ